MDVGTLLIAIIALLVAVAALILIFVYNPSNNGYALRVITGATTDTTITAEAGSIYIYPAGSTSTTLMVNTTGVGAGRQFIFINRSSVNVTLTPVTGGSIFGPGATRVIAPNTSANYYATADGILVYVPGSFA